MSKNKQRALDLERMFQRYQNVKKDLINAHKKKKVRKVPTSVIEAVSNEEVIMEEEEEPDAEVHGIHQSAQKKRPTDVRIF